MDAVDGRNRTCEACSREIRPSERSARVLVRRRRGGHLCEDCAALVAPLEDLPPEASGGPL